jgi:hypothetical protein
MAYLRNADTRLCRLVACLAEPVFMAIDFPDTATPRAHLVDT